MFRIRNLRPVVLAVAASLFLTPLAFADDEHHEDSTRAPAAVRPPGGPMGPGSMMGQGGPMGTMGPGAGGQGMPMTMGQDGAAQMMGMMRMMGMMGMMGEPGRGPMAGAGMGMGPEAMTEHVEGRIAFLRAELKITPAQSPDWDRFAAALRANAKKLAEGGTASGPGRAERLSLPQRLDREERWLEARLDGAREIKKALAGLYASFSDEQKAIAERLVPPHIGMMPMGRL